MPTLSKPQLTEAASVWRRPSLQMRRELLAIKNSVLESLGFYLEHDRPEDFDGKFKRQVKTHEKEVLTEIVGALTLAASISASRSTSFVIATLEKVQKDPALIFNRKFPSAIAWVLAQAYQRAEEKPGTFWPDIFGEQPAHFKGDIEKPTLQSISAGNVLR